MTQSNFNLVPVEKEKTIKLYQICTKYSNVKRKFAEMGDRILDEDISPVIFCNETVDRLIGYGIKSIQDKRHKDISGIYLGDPTFPKFKHKDIIFHGSGVIFEVDYSNPKFGYPLTVTIPEKFGRCVCYAGNMDLGGKIKRIHYQKDNWRNGTNLDVPKNSKLERELSEEKDRIIRLLK